MRDPELLLKLLHKMNDDPGGRIKVMRTGLLWTVSQMQVCHHIDLLIDVGHAVQEPGSSIHVRITNDGYDFLNAIKQDEKYEKNFLKYFHAGASYVEAAMKVVDTASKAATILAG